MRNLSYILFFAALLCVSCEWKLKSAEEESQQSLIEVERYDHLEYRYLTTGDFSALQEMSTEYPIETRTLIEDILKIGEVTDPEINTKFLKFYQDTTLQMLISDTEAEFANMDDINKGLNLAFAKLKRWFPDMDIPNVYTQISSLDQSIVVGNQSIGISLDKYLGADYPLYKRFNYTEGQLRQMSREYILPDCICFYLISIYPFHNFDTCSQVERDLHIGRIQWVVNKALERHFYKSKSVSAVDAYMKRNTNMSYDQLLRITDFSVFNVAGV